MLAATHAAAAAPPVSNTSYRDGHTRPRALAFNPEDGLLYAALSTSDEVAIVDPGQRAAARDGAQAGVRVSRRDRGAAGRRRARRVPFRGGPSPAAPRRAR